MERALRPRSLESLRVLRVWRRPVVCVFICLCSCHAHVCPGDEWDFFKSLDASFSAENTLAGGTATDFAEYLASGGLDVAGTFHASSVLLTTLTFKHCRHLQCVRLDTGPH